MELVVLDRIDMDVDADRLAAELSPRGVATAAMDCLRRLVAEAVVLARPRAAYRLASFEKRDGDAVVIDGTTLRSRILAVHLEDVHRGFPFVATCGSELATWAAAKSDLLERFWADAVMDRALGAATGALAGELERRYGLEKTGTLTPGSLSDWPLEEQLPLFRALGGVESRLGVRLTDGLMMDPVHSLSGIVFPTAADFEECRLCPRERCPKRRAPFEDHLYESRYAGAPRAAAE